jgi:hypothetical protein
MATKFADLRLARARPLLQAGGDLPWLEVAAGHGDGLGRRGRTTKDEGDRSVCQIGTEPQLTAAAADRWAR